MHHLSYISGRIDQYALQYDLDAASKFTLHLEAAALLFICDAEPQDYASLVPTAHLSTAESIHAAGRIAHETVRHLVRLGVTKANAHDYFEDRMRNPFSGYDSKWAQRTLA